MRFVFFKTPKPKKFNLYTRYHDPEKERLRKRRLEMGFEGGLTHGDELRLEIRKKWRKEGGAEEGMQDFGMSKNISYLIYFVLIGGGIYLIFFTDFVDKLLMLFGIGKIK